MGTTLALVSDAGSIRAEAIDSDEYERRFELSRGIRYVRAQILDGTGSILALTNPLWLSG